MSEPAQRKVCLASVAMPWWSRCSKPQAIVADTGVALLAWDGFVNVPEAAQCTSCLAQAKSMAPTDQTSASPAHILSVALLCGAVAGTWTAPMVALLEQWLSDEDDAARDILLDLAEQAGLHEGGWVLVERGWLRRDAHGTGNNPHVWMPLERKDEDGHRWTSPVWKRCPCGMYDDDEDRCARCDLTRHEHRLQRGRDCGSFVEASERTA